MFYKILLPAILVLSSFTTWAQNERCAHDYVQQRLMQNNAVYKAEVENYIREILPNIQSSNEPRNAPPIITIPVVVHIIHNGESLGAGANLSSDRVYSQIQTLNEDYTRTNDDAENTPESFIDIAANAEIQFCLATVNPDGIPTTGITRHVYSNIADIEFIEDEIKPDVQWDPNRYLNIYTADVPGGNVLGYSYLPTNTMVGSVRDGVVINYSNFGYVNESNHGRTCTHEVGHFLGLRHIWGNNNNNGEPIGCTSDDGIEDTPNSSAPYYGCPSPTQISCSSIDMSMNFMEYVNDDCMNLFTEGQKTVMRATLNGIRSDLAQSSDLVCDNAIDISCVDLVGADFQMGFESDQPAQGWTVENTNGDTKTWLIAQNTSNDWGPNNGEGLAVYLWNTSSNADDYLFSPCLDLIDGHTYRLSFSYACAEDNNGVYSEAFEVGFSEDQSSQTFVVPDNSWIFNNVNNPYPDYNDHSMTFVQDGDQSFSIGFHAISAANRYALQIDDFNIEDLGLNASTTPQITESPLNIYPNPSTGLVQIDLPRQAGTDFQTLEIYNTLGQLVYSKSLISFNEQIINLDLSDNKEGIYFVTLKSVERQISSKLVLK